MAQGLTEAVVEEIKARIDLVELISSYGVAVKRAGSSYKACCPFHHEKTPSFNIRPEKGFYHCFGCGKSGDAFRFVMEEEGLSFPEAARKLANLAGVKLEEREDPQSGLRKRLYALHAELAAFYRRCLLQAREAERARAYLASRELDGECAEKFSIGYAPVGVAAMMKWAEKYGFSADELDAAGVVLKPRNPGEHGYHRFGGRLMFPIRDRSGRVVAFSGRTLETDKAKMRGGKYVNSPETPIFRKSAVLYALFEAAGAIVKSPGREAIVCEGQIDVIRCHACGFPTAVASQGTAFTAEHVALLKKCCDCVKLVFDADGAGVKAAIRTGGEFLAAEVPVRVAALPQGEDPDSLLRTKGPEAFRARLDASESIIAFMIRTMRSAEAAPDSIDALRRISRAVLETIAGCPSAVMRASLIKEASSLMNLPASALEEDLASLVAARRARPKLRTEASDAAAPADSPASSFPAPVDAAAPEAVPPSRLETVFCEFLFDHERDAAMAQDPALPPPQAFVHEWTRRFVAAWREGATGGGDAIARLRSEMMPEERAWIDRVIGGPARAACSERAPEELFCDFLREIWAEALRRRRGEIDAAPTPENARRRYSLSMMVRTIERGKWADAAKLMKPESLGETQ